MPFEKSNIQMDLESDVREAFQCEVENFHTGEDKFVDETDDKIGFGVQNVDNDVRTADSDVATVAENVENIDNGVEAVNRTGFNADNVNALIDKTVENLVDELYDDEDVNILKKIISMTDLIDADVAGTEKDSSILQVSILVNLFFFATPD